MQALAAALITIAPLLGWQSGAHVKPSVAPGLMLSQNRGRGRELDLFAAGQHTRGGAASVDILYLQIGGRYVFDPDARTRPYVAATIGGTRLDVDREETLAPSGALGAGADIQLSPRVALRLDGRVHTTLTNATTSLQCNSSGTCAGSTSGSSFSQFVASAGLVFRLR